MNGLRRHLLLIATLLAIGGGGVFGVLAIHGGATGELPAASMTAARPERAGAGRSTEPGPMTEEPMVAEPSASPRVAEELARLAEAISEPRPVRKNGALVVPQPPDPRPSTLMSLLGDSPCPAVSEEKRRAAAERIDWWLAGASELLLLERGECAALGQCRPYVARRVKVLDSCEAKSGEERTHLARWFYDGGSDGEAPLFLDALFHERGKELALVMAASHGEHSTHSIEIPDLEVAMYRRGAQVIALAALPDSRGAILAPQISVNGVRSTLPMAETPRWYRFGELDGPAFRALVQTEGSGELGFWHWEEGWRKIAAFPTPTLADPEPHLDVLGTWLWRQHRRVMARAVLADFSTMDWGQATYRQEVLRALAIAGAPAEVRARVEQLSRQR